MGRIYIDCRVRGQNINQPLTDKLGQPLLRVYKSGSLQETKVGYGASNCGYWDINDYDGDLSFCLDFTPAEGSSRFRSKEDYVWMVHSLMDNSAAFDKGEVRVSHMATQGRIAGEQELMFTLGNTDLKFPIRVVDGYKFSDFHDETIRFIVVWDYIRNLIGPPPNQGYMFDARMYVRIKLDCPDIISLTVKQYNPDDINKVMTDVLQDENGYYTIMNEYHGDDTYQNWNDSRAMSHKRMRISFSANRLAHVKQTLMMNSVMPQIEGINKELQIERDGDVSYIDIDTFIPKTIRFEASARLKILSNFNPSVDRFLDLFNPTIGDHYYGKNELVEVSAPVLYKNDSMESAVFCKGASGTNIDDIVGSKASIIVPEGDSVLEWNFELGKIPDEIRDTVIGGRGGYCSLNDKGSIIQALELNQDLIVYTSLGIYKIVPFNLSGITGFGKVKLFELGCYAVGGNNQKHIIVSRNGHLYSLTTEGLKHLDYSEFFEQHTTGEILINSLIQRNLFFIQCGISNCYILSESGLTKTSVQTFQLFDSENNCYGISKAASAGTNFTLVSGRVNLGSRGMKTVIGVEVESENISNLCLTIQPYFDYSSVEVSLPANLVDIPLTRNFINTNISGREFTVKLTGTSTGAAKLNSVKLKWITIDGTVSSGMEV